MTGRRPLAAGAAGVWTIAVLIPFAGRDFDPFHDGAMLAPAIVARDGGLPHIAVEAAYGPLIPLLQGFALLFGDAPVLTLRILNVVLCAAVAVGLTFIGDDDLPGWPVPVRAAVGAALLWPAMSDVLRGAPMHPWPSVPAALCAVLSLVAARHALRAERSERRGRAVVLAASAGLLLALMFLFRLAPGLAVVMVAPALFLVARGKDPGIAVVLRWMVAGSLAGLVLAAGALASVGALRAFVEQAILAPFGFFVVGTVTEQPGGLLYWIEWMFPVARGLALLGGATLILRWAVVARSSVRRVVLIAAAAGVVLIGVVLRLVPVGLISSRIGSGQFRVGAAGAAVLLVSLAATCAIVAALVPLLGRMDALFENGRVAAPLRVLIALVAGALLPPVETVAVAAAVAAGALVWRALRGHPATGLPRRELLALSVAGIALGALLEAISVPDTRHFWWGIPVGLVLVLGLVAVRGLFRPVVVGLVASIGLGILAGLPGTLQPRTPYGDDTVAAGMVGRPDSVRAIDATTRLLRERTSGEPALFLAREGDLSVALGSYAGVDRWFLYTPGVHSTSTAEPERFDGVDWVVVNPVSCQACHLAVPGDFTPVAETDRIVLYGRRTEQR